MDNNITNNESPISNLIDSKPLYENIIEAVQEGIWVTDSNDAIMFANPAMADIAGIPCEQIVGRNIYNDFSPEVTKEIIEYYNKAKNTKQSVYYNIKLKTPTGKATWQNGWLIPRYKNDCFIGIICTVRDVTKEKLLNTEFINSQAQFQALFEQSGGYCMILNPNTSDGIPIIIDANKAACELHGYTKEEFIGRPVSDIDDEEGKKLVKERTALIMKGKPFYVENTHVRKDGTTMQVAVNAKRIDIADNDPVIFTTEYDITDQKKAEEALKKSNIQYKQLFNYMPVMFQVIELIYDEKGRVIDYYYLEVNPIFEDLVKKTKEQLIGHTAKSIFGHIDEYWLELSQKVEETGKSVQSQSYDKELDKYYESFTYKIDNKQIAIIFKDITDRKKIDEKLRISETQFRGIFDQAAVGIARVAINGTWLEVNQKLCDIVGYSNEELLSKTLQDITHPDDLKYTLNYQKKLLQGESKTCTIEKRYFKRDGNIIWTRVTANLVRDTNNAPDYFIVIIENIDDRKHAEESLIMHSEIMTHMREAVYLISVESETIVFSNKNLEELFGYDPGEMLNMEVSRINASTDKSPEEIKNEILKDLLENYFWEGEILNVKKDGTFFWTFAKASVFEHPKFGMVILSVHTDINDRKQSEIERNNLAKFPSENPNPVLRIAKNGNILYYNLAAEKILQSWNSNIKEPIPKKWHNIIKDTILNDIIVTEEYQIDQRLFLLTLTPIYNAGYVNIYATDITQSRKTEEQLRQSQKMDAVGQLAGGIAHDFNNMLGGIIGCADLLSLELSADLELTKLTDMIIDFSGQAAELTNKLLTFSRKGESIKVLFDIHDSIDKITTMLKRSIDKRIEIVMLLDAEVSTINGDVTQIQNAILNLSINARDAMPEGGKLIFRSKNVVFEKGNKKLSDIVKIGKYIEIEVEDTGIGMSQEVQERIFEPFYTTKVLGKGTGLGLSAFYKTIQETQGFFDIFSAQNKGTIMKVYLPVSEVNSVTIEKSPDAVVKGVGNILVVDDESELLKILQLILKDLGYEVFSADGGKAALDIYQERHADIDLVILDIIMPKISGKDLFYALKKINPDVKVIISSGYSQDAIVSKLIEDGAKSFIQKPYRQSILSQEIKKVLC